MEAARKAIEELVLKLTPAIDALGVPLFKHMYFCESITSYTAFSKQLMVDIWKVERKHLACIQNPDGLPQYTITGNITKGGMKLPVFRCSRGTTSLESFHLHLAR